MTTAIQTITIISERLQASPSQIADYCQRWKIVEFALFGSVLRDDFRFDSDVDVLITLAPHHGWSLFDWLDMQQELETMFQRKVDLVDKRGLKNPYRRSEILKTHQVIYASKQP
ncbi:nucleotidyltransferase family protein [Gloeocapsopsis sp. IPPAS B-1203]|uniref:nucleotidyltransferase family protein n=1 Tax=Gloeocapsopsis sp. IPPAS B-1203 TaxID=2049454 RepID=UPI000C18E51A|nr:nucleotidyltransferase family protein [Gloeocapsopsis sp. IPPAS B-1203]PIG94997.1 DNA polymerase subunit beta [Gloeocapsopsis sp. IPPAS B-1203]